VSRHVLRVCSRQPEMLIPHRFRAFRSLRLFELTVKQPARSAEQILGQSGDRIEGSCHENPRPEGRNAHTGLIFGFPAIITLSRTDLSNVRSAGTGVQASCSVVRRPKVAAKWIIPV